MNVQALKKRLTDPVQKAVIAFRRKANPYPKGSIHYVPTIEESIELVTKATREEVVDLYNKQLGGQVGEIAIVGDFDEQSTLAQLEGIFKGWTTSVAYKRIPRKVHSGIKGGRESILIPDKKNALYISGYNLKMKDSSPDYPALKMGNYILGASGLGSILFDRLRSKEGISYGAGSQFNADARDEYALFMIFAMCNPKNINKADKVVLEVINNVRKKGISAVQLAEAQRGYLQKQQVSRSNDGQLVGMLRSGLYLGRTFDYYATLESKIEDLDLEEVNRALRRYVLPERLIIFRSGDLRKAEGQPPK